VIGGAARAGCASAAGTRMTAEQCGQRTTAPGGCSPARDNFPHAGQVRIVDMGWSHEALADDYDMPPPWSRNAVSEHSSAECGGASHVSPGCTSGSPGGTCYG
jgi:hypothetical protein